MEEDRREENQDQNAEEDAGGFSKSDDLAEEIQQLVEAMARAARNVWSSDERRQLENDLRRGLGSLLGSLEDALERFGRSEQGQDLQEQATRVANRVRESELAAELKEGLTVGLRSAADEVRKFADSFEENQTQSPPSQDIPVESDKNDNDEETA
ncbi:MAG: hypothetical protein OXI52_11275 [Caldilineaceae bacterium]|nr:hypothetical protein [Caldilineaceae bacterium]MDE0312837.1 hypothetical protein [Caldilineaceae bacterium]